MIGIETIIESDRWASALADAEGLAARVFDAACACEPKLGGSAALLLCDDAAMRALNARFRGKDAPTNVLSFPSGEPAPGFLGDVALAFEICAREAADQGVDLSDHAAHLIAHGLLHLVGHDHIAAVDARRMEKVEIDILDALGVSNPYACEES